MSLATPALQPAPKLNSLSPEALAALDANSRASGLLLTSFNILKLRSTEALLRELKSCAAGEIPESHISKISPADRFWGYYDEHKTSRETSENFSASLGIEGSYGVYSASVQLDYSKTELATSTTFRSSYSAHIELGTLSFKGSQTDMARLLLPEMKAQLEAINSLAAAKSFTDTWGTHLVTGVKLGGLLFISMNADASSVEKKEKISATLKAQYSGIGSAEATATATSEVATLAKSENLAQEVTAIGGSFAKAAAIDPADQKTFLPWIESCNDETACGIAQHMEIYMLATGDARKFLKEYIDLSMLVFSLHHPALFTAQQRTAPFSTNSVTASAMGVEGYKIIGGGFMTHGNSYPLGCYPQVQDNNGPTGWHVVSHDVNHPCDPSEAITALAFAIYDPENLLQVRTINASGTNPEVGGDAAVATLSNEWLLTGGGVRIRHSGGPMKFMISSFPNSPHSWEGFVSDYQWAAKATPVETYAIGIKSNHAALEITRELFTGPEVHGQHNKPAAQAQSMICGGGVRVWNNKGDGNMLKQSFPATPTRWEGYDHDAFGKVSPANAQAFAIVLSARIKLS